ncbi:hypothetical protein C7S16_4514 [Burkholderia thailandensis]|uniref:Uncharacterized protein n=1 Tax=Burkholderia thailandensis TaxID=57975 RepID=A0AAW9CVD9_BURTH|nr:hypothetical protein [Burkholderia thailandensis]
MYSRRFGPKGTSAARPNDSSKIIEIIDFNMAIIQLMSIGLLSFN